MKLIDSIMSLKRLSYQESEIIKLPDRTEVILSTLTGEEDRLIADYLQAHMDKALANYGKLETLAHSVKWLKTPSGEEIDLRGVKYIGTEEFVEGVEVKKQKHVIIRELLETWPDILLDSLFVKFGELVQALESKVSKSIKLEMGRDLLTARIVQLTEELGLLLKDAESRGLDIPEYQVQITPKQAIEEDVMEILDHLDHSSVRRKPSLG